MLDDTRTAMITGAGGFVGRHLVAECETATTWNLIGVGRQPMTIGQRTRVLGCDLLNADLMKRVVHRHRPDIVIHLAAQSYVPKAIAAPAETISNNVTAQVNVLEACRSASIDPTILIVGSSEEYGAATPDEMPLKETQPFRPTNPYAVSKVAQDMLGLQYHLAYGMRIVRLRPFNHVGPGQSDRFVLSGFARQIAEAEAGRAAPMVLTGNLDAERDFLDVRDVARAYRMAVDVAVPGDVYNIASGIPWRIGRLLETLIAQSRVPLSVRQDPARMRPSDIPIHVGDASAFRHQTGWEPRIDLETTLLDTLDYWRGVFESSVNHDE